MTRTHNTTDPTQIRSWREAWTGSAVDLRMDRFWPWW